MNTSEFIERRKHERLQAQEDTIISPTTNRKKFWKIIDISNGGLAFRYVSKVKKELDKSDEIDIIKHGTPSDTPYVVRKIPFKIVSDFEIVKEQVSNFSVRRCGIRFGELTEFQISRLEHFIQNYTLAEAY